WWEPATEKYHSLLIRAGYTRYLRRESPLAPCGRGAGGEGEGCPNSLSLLPRMQGRYLLCRNGMPTGSRLGQPHQPFGLVLRHANPLDMQRCEIMHRIGMLLVHRQLQPVQRNIGPIGIKKQLCQVVLSIGIADIGLDKQLVILR